MENRKPFVADVTFLMNQWDFSKNSMNVSEITVGSHFNAHWICKKCKYSWSCSVKSRFNSKGKCPCCESNKVIKNGINDVMTVVPELRNWYDEEANLAEGRDVSTEGVSSEKRFYFKCLVCGRKWQTSIISQIKKTKNGYEVVGCPHYNTSKIPRDSVLKVSDDILMKFWDEEKNTEKASEVPINSNKVYFWKCKKCGYEWEKVLREFRRLKVQCPCCEQNRIVKEGINDIFTLVPDSKQYFDFEKNREIDVYKLKTTSVTKIFWKCPTCSHEWENKLRAALSWQNEKNCAFKGCPVCESKRGIYISEVPRLIKIWDFEENIKENLNPDFLKISSPLKAKWKCQKCEYRWTGSINSRYRSKISCPVCDGKKKIAVKGKSDILTLCPELNDQFDLDNNPDIDIYSLVFGSHVKIAWKCNICGYKWSSKIKHRVKKLSENRYEARGCPSCSSRINKKRTFAQEYPELAEIHIDSLSGHSLADVHGKDSNFRTEYWRCKDCGEIFQSSVQSMIQSYKKGYSGCPYCSHIKVREGRSFGKLHPDLICEYDDKNEIDIFSVFPNSKKSVIWICKNDPTHVWTATFALRHCGGGECPVCNHNYPIKGINTFSDIYPDLVPLWCNKNNRKPDNVFFDSCLWFYWICPDCKAEFGAYIKDIVDGKNNCPYCNNRRVLSGVNSLAGTHPEIARHWSPDNDDLPDNYFPTSSVYKLWICPTCKGEFSTSIRNMVTETDNCPYCSGRKVLPGYNSFAVKHPKLLEELDFINSYSIADPDELSENSNVKLWWICEQGHKYPMSPADRLYYKKRDRKSCPHCKGLRRKKRHFI